MDLRGTIQDSKVILDSGLSIPDGTRVVVTVLKETGKKSPRKIGTGPSPASKPKQKRRK